MANPEGVAAIPAMRTKDVRVALRITVSLLFIDADV